MRRANEPPTRYLPFGYNRWRQKPLRIATPGGQIFLTRELHGTVRIEIVPDGSRMSDHNGWVEVLGGRSAETYCLRLVHEVTRDEPGEPAARPQEDPEEP